MYTLSNQQFKGKVPQIDPNAFVAPSVFLSGDVRIGNIPASGQALLQEAMSTTFPLANAPMYRISAACM